MIENLIIYLGEWNVKTSERQKLQHVYVALTIVVVLGAGLISLFDPYLGHNIVLVAIFAVAVFFANAVVWNLLQAGLLAKLPSKRKSRK